MSKMRQDLRAVVQPCLDGSNIFTHDSRRSLPYSAVASPAVCVFAKRSTLAASVRIMPELFTRISFLSVALFLSASPHQAGGQAQEWGEFRGTSDNRGTVGGTVEATWSVPMGNAVRALSLSGRVLLAGADRSGELAAIDLPTGRVLWRAKLPTSVHNDPIIADGIAVVTYGDLPSDEQPGGAWAFDLRTGRVLWKYHTRWALMPSPALIRDIVVLAGSDDCIHGVGLRDGLRRYHVCIAMSSAMSNPKRSGNNVFFGTTDGHLVSLDGTTGMIRWIRRLPIVTHAGDASVAVGPTSLFITGTAWGGPRNFMRDTSFLVAARLTLEAFLHEPFSERFRYFARQRVASLALDDGAVQWSSEVGSSRNISRNQAGTPAVAGDILIVSSPVGSTLTALRTSSGQRVWQVVLPSRHRGVATIQGDTVYVGLESGQLQAYALQTGHLLRSCKWPGAFSPTAPLIVGQTFVYGASDGVLRAIPMPALAEAMRVGGACIQASPLRAH